MLLYPFNTNYSIRITIWPQEETSTPQRSRKILPIYRTFRGYDCSIGIFKIQLTNDLLLWKWILVLLFLHFRSCWVWISWSLLTRWQVLWQWQEGVTSNADTTNTKLKVRLLFPGFNQRFSNHQLIINQPWYKQYNCEQRMVIGRREYRENLTERENQEAVRRKKL